MLTWKVCTFIFRNFQKRRFSSALYVTDDKAQKNYALVTPVIEFEKELEDEERLRNNIFSRNLNVNLDKLVEKWNFFQFVHDRKTVLEQTRTEIAAIISDLLKNQQTNKEEIEKLKLHMKIVKNDLQNVKTFYYGVEEDTMLSVLNLPNKLHQRTPAQEENVIYTFRERTDGSSKNHLEIGTNKGYINHIDSYTCFLKADAALFEIYLQNYFRTCLEEMKFIQFNCPNFCRTVVVEGCGEHPSNVLGIEDQDSVGKANQLHLCGGSSLYSFMAYFTRHVIQKPVLPIKIFSIGKKYQLITNTSERSLFNLNQNLAVSFFIATLDEEEYLESLISQIITIYEKLGYHFRLSLLPANQLDKAESLHLSIQMYSNFLSKYVEVGNISMYDSYLSKRLLLTCTEKTEKMYPKVISGTLVNVPSVLACVLENNSLSGDSLLTDLLKQYL